MSTAAGRTCTMCAAQATFPETCHVPDHMASCKLSKKNKLLQNIGKVIKMVTKFYCLVKNAEYPKPGKKQWTD